MATTTSLITFHVRAPPSTRAVSLYGSWDNFRKSYPMQRDSRIAKEHWSGCHTFADIICDGEPNGRSRSRSGGLKMGGTYWYFYKLDDEIEFHNSAEPSTTACPLLPGQLVNVLEMPFSLSGNRSRNPSVSSTSSDRRTMNPEDKFISPRPAPMPTKQYRIKTSPTDVAKPDDTIWTNSQSTEKTTKFFRLPRKASLDTFSSSGSSKATGLRQAIAIRTARSQSPDPLAARYKPDVPASRHHQRSTSAQSDQRPDVNKLFPPTSRGSTRDLLLRSQSSDSVPVITSFKQHRQLITQLRDHSPLRSLDFDDDITPIAPRMPFMGPKRSLDTLKEVASAQCTPIWTSDPIRDGVVDLEKRLPTLPNTPSSAYPASANSVLGTDLSEAMQNLESHFSATTVDSESCSRTQSLAIGDEEQSHFSFFSNTTGRISNFSIGINNPGLISYRPTDIEPTEIGTGVSTCFEIGTGVSTCFENISPISENACFDESDYFRHALNNEEPPSEYGQDTITNISSDGTNTPSTSYYDNDTDSFNRAHYQHPSSSISAAMRMKRYALPEHECSSTVTLKGPRSNSDLDEKNITGVPHGRLEVYHTGTDQFSADSMGHSENMKRLLNELSYLSEMIQH